MKQNKKTTNTHSQHPSACADCTDAAVIAQEVKMTADDFKLALLVVSVAVNVFVLTTWIAAQSSSLYANQLVQFIAG